MWDLLFVKGVTTAVARVEATHVAVTYSLAQVANAIAFQIATKQAGIWSSPAGLSKMQLNAAAVNFSHVHRFGCVLDQDTQYLRHSAFCASVPLNCRCQVSVLLHAAGRSRQVTAGGGEKRGCWIGLNPNECQQRTLKFTFVMSSNPSSTVGSR